MPQAFRTTGGIAGRGASAATRALPRVRAPRRGFATLLAFVPLPSGVGPLVYFLVHDIPGKEDFSTLGAFIGFHFSMDPPVISEVRPAPKDFPTGATWVGLRPSVRDAQGGPRAA